MKKTGILRGVVFSFVGVFSLAFVLYCINLELWLNNKSVAVLTSIESYLVTILYFVIPAAIGGAIISSAKAVGVKAGLIRCLPISLPLLIYAIPYYYIYSLLQLTQDSVRALIYAVLFGLLECLVFYLEGVAFFYIANAICDAVSKRRGVQSVMDISASDFSNPFTVGAFAALSIKAFVMAVLTSIDTIGYLIEYRGTYLIGEIVTIVLDFVLIISELLLAHFILVFIMKWVGKNYDSASINQKEITKEV